ncbi:branched-chain amino acid transport system permease protein [Arthrobacter sp. V4I6]|uniref:branched-chain amino acid ABC transporter permease n=1 Tax=unclassified Arthrobacter TaxID=235627 RepID=UPI00278A0607|nr:MULTISPECIES: branched-chain amino acid ABC transporter permease [unclassified Arthrobacter]MDQ0821602.1 branched-chain amino acid transport system permease protein [Arthrobacter sp. V1I7]MDQ0855867.1 branched-chain amino acid transport system permease protein [Arthrobacter sp. V4I6]
MITLLQLLITGLLVGAVYALMSSGLTLIFGVMRVVNLAHGAFAVLAAYLTYTLWSLTGLDPLLSVPIIVAVMFGVGWLSYNLVVRHVRGSHISMTVLVTFGIALTIEGIAGFVWGNQSRTVRTAYTDTSVQIGPFFLPTATLLAAAIAVVLLGALFLILNQTWMGRAVRASAVNESGALLVGVSVKSISASAFALGIATLGAGGAIIAVMYPFIPGTHYQWIARLLAIVVLGGLGSLMGAVIGALLIGVAEQLATQYVGASWVEIVPFLIIFIILIVRPQGILGQKLREDATV